MLASMLLVAAPATANWSTLIAVLVVPLTLLVATGFWYASRRQVGFRRIAGYCVLGGALGGALDASLCYSALRSFDDGSLIATAFSFPIVGVVGVFTGIAYGLGFLPLLLLQASARGMRRTEAVDRCLIGCGLWGLAASQLGAGLQPRLSLFSFEMQPMLSMSWSAVAIAHGVMLVLGFIPWAGRRVWLQRVVSGKIQGWQLCSVDDFGAAVATLPVFCKPLIPRARKARVLVRSRTGDVYRGEVLEPKYLVP